jgi:CRP/FNR family transcriptional regulator, anaerobic regulatory protein
MNFNIDNIGQFYTNPTDQLRAFYTFFVPTLSDDSWAKMEPVLKVRTLKKGQLLVKEGVVCHHISFINKGLARMYYNTPEREVTMCFFNENTYVCDYPSFLSRKPAQVNVQAITDMTLVETVYEDLQDMYHQVPEANQMGRMIAEQLFIKMHDDKTADVRDTLEQRYMTLVNEQPWVLQHVPQYIIASYLGITPEALSRVKRRMNKKTGVVGV